MAPKRITSNVPLQTAVPVQIVKSEVPTPVAAAAPVETPVAPAPKKKTIKKKEVIKFKEMKKIKAADTTI
jgi:hypothetical protein